MDFDDILAQASVRDLLVLRPVTTRAMICRSRGVKDSNRACRSAASLASSGRARSRSIPAWMASSSSCSFSGLVRNSIAPDFIARAALAFGPPPLPRIGGPPLSLGSAVLPTLAHVLRLSLDQAVLLLILVAVDLRTLDQAVLLLILVAVDLRTLAVVLLHTLTVVGPLVFLATRVVLVAVAATLHAMATVIAGGTATGEVKGSGGDSYSDRNCY
jgi:hypothetical protein